MTVKKGDFTKKLLKWHQKENNRAMPWKGEKDPYKIWLSEVILQQPGWNKAGPTTKNSFSTSLPSRTWQQPLNRKYSNAGKDSAITAAAATSSPRPERYRMNTR